MSDAPDKGATAPLAPSATPAVVPTTAPMNAHVHARPATQVSASAVPSTLESPSDPNAPQASTEALAVRDDGPTEKQGLPYDPNEINGAAVIAREAAQGDAAARELALREAAARDPVSHRAGAPKTLMSPAVGAMGGPHTDVPVGPAVVDAREGELAQAFASAHNRGPAPQFMGQGPHGGGGHHAGHYGQATPRRGMSTTTLALLIGGAVIVVFGIGLVITFVVVRTRLAEALTRPVTHVPAPPPPTVPEPPRVGTRAVMGGTKPHVAVVSAGALDPEGVRIAVDRASTRIDSCFQNTELEPPNHEVAAYDLDVAASGAVTRAESSTPATRCPKLDACVVPVLRSVRMPKSAAGAPVKLAFSAHIGAP